MMSSVSLALSIWSDTDKWWFTRTDLLDLTPMPSPELNSFIRMLPTKSSLLELLS